MESATVSVHRNCDLEVKTAILSFIVTSASRLRVSGEGAHGLRASRRTSPSSRAVGLWQSRYAVLHVLFRRRRRKDELPRPLPFVNQPLDA
jgi:hypothetical protein